MHLLTHSRQDTFKTCPKRHFYAYELGLRPTSDARALRMGTVYHQAQEAIAPGADRLPDAVELIRRAYDIAPSWASSPEAMLDWQYECETIVRLLCGYCWRWANEKIEYLVAEQVFRLPLVNPATGKPSRTFAVAGKIDGIIRLTEYGERKSVMEHKLLGEDISEDSHLRKRLNIDHQVSMYILAARRLGFPVSSAFYNVTRKPTIGPTPVPLLDENGEKIVLDASGARIKTQKGTWRQTGDAALGYTLKTRPMTTDEWGEKLYRDIADRPHYYYQRIEVPRLDSDLEEYSRELWQIAHAIRAAQLNNAFYRTCNKNTCAFCPYFDICSTRNDLHSVPDGFEIVTNLHPELEEIPNVHSSAGTTGTTETCPAASTTGTAEERDAGQHHHANSQA